MRRRDWTPFEGYAAKLRSSPNRLERDSFLLGIQSNEGWPVLLHEDLLFEHMHMLGGTGSGKTSVGLTTLLRQMLHRDMPLIIVDCKGDSALFNTVWRDAVAAGRTFKWFTLTPNRSTYLFNPFDTEVFSQMSLSEIVGFIIQSLNLNHGSEYGRGWFTIGSRILARRAIEATLPVNRRRSAASQPNNNEIATQLPPIQSLRELHEAVYRMARNDAELKAGMHLCYMLESLADIEQINLLPTRHQPESAVRHAIHMPEVIRQRQVVYFYLVAAVDVALVGEIARLILYAAYTAAIAHQSRYGVRPKVYFVCDEAQMLIAQNIQVVLTQARSQGLACILSHQSMSQLNPPSGVDLRELFMGCTAIKQIHSARDPWLQRYISDMSGRVKYFSQSYDQDANDVLAGLVGPRHTHPEQDGTRRVSIQEYLGPRLTTDDINDYSREENVSIVGIEHGKGLSQFYGWTPVYTDWPLSFQQYQYHNECVPWPVRSDATIEIDSDWPQNDGHTIPAAKIEPLAYDDLVNQVDQTLWDMKRSLDDS